MSLKVWLPLTGDLRNLGTSNYEIAAYRGSIVYHNNGKIGKCFHSNGANNLIIKDIMQDFYNYPAYSICAWACADGQNTGHTGSGIISAGNWNSQLINLAMSNWSTDHYTKLRISGSNWNRTYDYNFQTGIWYHIVVCDDGDKTYAYVNGELIGNSAASFMPTSVQGDNICIGGATYSGSMNFVGRINDVRVYDHCLSLSEIKEISQGLILHYKFDDKPINISPNLVTSITKGGQTTVDTTTTFGVQTSGSNTDTYFTLNLSESITVGQRYLLSCYASGIPGNDYWTFPLGTQSNSALPFNIHNGFNNIEFVANDINWGSNRLFLDDTKRISSVCKFYNFILTKLENEVKDSSGYNHNGEIISELHVSNDSARYKNSTLFDGIDDCIIVPYNTICPENIFTINLWFKKDALGSKNYETLFGGPGGFEMDTRAGSATSLSLYMASTRNGNRATGITMNEWHMITMTRDGTAEKYYVDGEFKSEIEAKSMPNGIYRIGAWASNTGQNYYGLISDFRIYATPLLDSDIKKLYNTSMSVDRANQLHTFELEEADDVKTLQQGILTGNVVEPFVTLDDGSHWQLLMYHYVDKGNNLFTQSTALDCNKFGLFSRLAYVDDFVYDDKYEFYVIQDDIEYRWTQTNKPTATSPSGFTAIDGYTNPVNGLVKASSNSYFGYNSWWGACGCWTKYSTGGKTGIPGFGAHNAAGMCERYLALYARIDEPHGKISYDKFNQFTQFIER